MRNATEQYLKTLNQRKKERQKLKIEIQNPLFNPIDYLVIGKQCKVIYYLGMTLHTDFLPENILNR